MHKHKVTVNIILPLLLMMTLAACGQPQATADFDLTQGFPDSNVVQGWETDGAVETYNEETLYDLVNGQADAFFVYGFEQVAVQRYTNAADEKLRVTIWQLASDKDAFGLFTSNVAGTPISIGRANDADTDPGRRLAFWQERYFVQIFARQASPEEEILAFGEAVSAALPEGGTPPTLVNRLPSEGLVDRSAIFFHEEISIQNNLWLGGQNLLGLSAETDGLVAQYELDDTRAQLLLIAYAEADAASAALSALQEAQVDGIVLADTSEAYLGAVFGSVDMNTAEDLLEKALE